MAAVHTFAYSPIPLPPTAAFPAGLTVHRPLVIAHLKVPNAAKSFSCVGLLDSGADWCVFPLSFAAPLGLDTLTMKMDMTGGVGSTANATYYDEIQIDIALANGAMLSYTTTAGFTAGLEAIGIGLLGQHGLFENFRVQFDHSAKLFYIEG